MFITNDGTAIPIANELEILGTGSTFTTGGTNIVTIELTGLTDHAVLVGAGTPTITNVGPTATAGQVLQSQGSTSDPAFSTATYPSTTTIDQLLYSSSANTVTGLTTGNNGVLITNSSGVPSWLPDGTTGQVLTATTGSPPSWGSITTGVSSVTGTANQILASPTTGAVVLSLIGPYTPATYTAHGVLVGEGTSSIVAIAPTANTGAILQNNSGADPSYSTATYPSTTTINEILYSSSNNVVGQITAANSAVLVSTSAGVPQWSGTMTNGQVVIGSTGATPTAATLTAGTGVSITNGAGSITIAATGSEMAWTDEAVSFNAAAGNGYFITAGSVIATLPASPSQGNTISFTVDTTSSFEILANTGQTIRGGAAVSASAGTAASNARGDSITLVYRSADTSWIANAMIGTWTIT